MKKPLKIVAGSLAGLTVALLATPSASAQNNTSTLELTLTGSISVTTPPAATVTMTAPGAPVGTATATDTMVVNANTSYNVTVRGAKAKMTKYVSGAYTDSVQLASGTLLTPTVVGVGAPTIVTVGTTAQKIVSSAGLVTDTVTLTYAQPIVVGDAPTTYRNDLTFTTSAGL